MKNLAENITMKAEEILNFYKTTAPFSIITNALVGLILLIIGVIMLRDPAKTKGKVIGGRICIVISIIAFIGTIVAAILSYVV